MLLLKADKIKKSYGGRLLFSVDHLEIHFRDRIGLVGLNGSGKTTLMNILTGNLETDEGSCRRYVDFSYIHQFTTNNNDIELKDYLSGGEKSRAVLLAAFDSNKPLCFADEPTNHLDLDGIKLLEKEILRYQGALLIISHDRELLDQVCNRIIEIENAKVTNYRGNYQSYLLSKKRQQDRAEFDYQQYQQEKLRLEQTLQESRKKVASVRKTPRRMGNSEARLHKRESGEIQKKLARSSKALQSRLEHMKPCERPFREQKVKFYCTPLEQPGAKILVRCDNLDLNLGTSELLKSSGFILPKGTRTALIGANGTGKTSLLRLLAARDPHFKIAPGTRLGYLTQELEDLDLSLTVLETVMKTSIQPETTARTLLASLLFKAVDIKKRAAVLSGGERVKLALAQLLLSNANLLLLDEPNNYLDVSSTEALQELIIDYPGTILFVSHDRQLIRKGAHRIISISDHKLTTFEDGYKQYAEWLDKANVPGSQDQLESKQLLLKMRCAEIAARIAKPRKSDDLKLLKQEYDNLISQIGKQHQRSSKTDF
ncbi:MAG: ABC-F family ATP-binding cassette domain-containing protein [Syntrophomonadaceae bacterium]|nr:ABC-F family ATP-binding cassette domain-containing protein [Syntrophomonadaceae bacterium]